LLQNSYHENDDSRNEINDEITIMIRDPLIYMEGNAVNKVGLPLHIHFLEKLSSVCCRQFYPVVVDQSLVKKHLS